MKSCCKILFGLLLVTSILVLPGCYGATSPDVPDTDSVAENAVLPIVENQASSYSIIISERASEAVNTMAMDLRKTVGHYSRRHGNSDRTHGARGEPPFAGGYPLRRVFHSCRRR